MNDVMETDRALTVSEQAFETDIFGAPVWRLTVSGNGDVPPVELEKLLRRARTEKAALIACRLPETSSVGERLHEYGFRKVERLITFYRPLAGAAEMPDGIEVGGKSDTDAAVEIARSVFRFDRYHADPEISDDVADEIKALWVRNGMNGRSDTPLVARVEGKVAGFNLCMRHGEDAVIDLIGVADGYQGRGIGEKLVAGSLAHYAGRAKRMRVGTQETNTVSLSMYRRAGFKPHDASETWHWTG